MEKNKFGPDVEYFEEYFKDDLSAIEEELEKSKKYSDIIDKEIDALSNTAFTTKGSQHYLIEYITNAVELQTQRQGLRKDRVAIKKLIMDYANRKHDKESGSDGETNILEAVKNLLAKEETQQVSIPEKTSEELDDDIDNILNNTKED